MHVVSASILAGWTLLSDDEVVARVMDGQTALFEILMRRYNQRLYRTARAVLRSEEEAEDVLQQAYLNAYSHLRQFDGRAAFATWLTRIVVHEAIARARRRGRSYAMDAHELSALGATAESGSGPDPERLAMSRELGALLENAIDRLPDGAREVFVLRQVEGMSTSEVADVLEISEAVVKTRLSRARAALRRELYEHAHIATSDAFRFLGRRCDRIVAVVLDRLS